MPSKVRFFPEIALAVIRFTGEMARGDVVQTLAVTYESREYEQLKYSLVDFRECSFKLEISELDEVIALVRQYGHKNRKVRTVLLVDSPKLTAIAHLFQSELAMKEKSISIFSTLDRVLGNFHLGLSLPELELMLREGW